MENQTQDTASLKGCFRLRIREDDKVVGDSGWMENLVTNDGIEKFFASCFAGSTGSLQVSHLSIGTGGVPASDATALTGETVDASLRAAVALGFTQRTNSTATATMQFGARAYPSLVTSPSIVKGRVTGFDENGEKIKRRPATRHVGKWGVSKYNRNSQYFDDDFNVSGFE